MLVSFLLVLLMGTAIVGNTVDEGRFLRCGQALEEQVSGQDGSYSVEWRAPTARFDCVHTSADGGRTVVAIQWPWGQRALLALAGVWLVLGLAVVAVLLRPSRIVLLDRAGATTGLGVVVGGVLALLVAGQLDTAALLWAIAAGSGAAALRARRLWWLAALVTAAAIWVLLVFSTISHPATPRPSMALLAGLAGGGAVWLVRRLRARVA